MSKGIYTIESFQKSLKTIKYSYSGLSEYIDTLLESKMVESEEILDKYMVSLEPILTILEEHINFCNKYIQSIESEKEN